MTWLGAVVVIGGSYAFGLLGAVVAWMLSPTVLAVQIGTWGGTFAGTLLVSALGGDDERAGE